MTSAVNEAALERKETATQDPRDVPSTPTADHLVLIQIEGMHCHRCESTIQRVLGKFPGVREVEVDFPSGQASVLHERGSVTADQLMKAIDAAGYRARSFIEREFDEAKSQNAE